jgi:hypothetical protein
VCHVFLLPLTFVFRYVGSGYTNVVFQLSLFEYAWLDWCNLIRMQITTKYKTSTKYNDNLRPNKYKESWKTTFVYPEPTYRNTKVKGRRNMFGLYWLQVIPFVLAHNLSPYVTYDRLLASTASWMSLVEHTLLKYWHF